MNILVLQLKRIGDLILTTPALAALRHARPEARITLVVMEGCRELVPAIDSVDETLVLGRGAVFGVMKKLLLGRFDVCLDFTGSDRSALLAVLSGARRRVAFRWAKRRAARSLAYNEFVDSPVREAHTVDHYLHLLRGLEIDAADAPPGPVLRLPAEAQARAAALLAEHGIAAPYAILHAGSARQEKYWDPSGWIHLVTVLRERHGLACVLTGGSDPFERAHVRTVATAQTPKLREGNARKLNLPLAEAPGGFADVAGKLDLLSLAALVAEARLVVSCDTAVVHLAAAFGRPQVALFGPTNPFHWRPRHEAAVVLSARHPEAPMESYDPRMKGAPMGRLSTEVVIRATDALLAAT